MQDSSDQLGEPKPLDAPRIAKFLEDYIAAAGLRLNVNVTGTTVMQDGVEEAKPVTGEFTGTDVPLLLARNGELLHALEHLCAKLLGLSPEQHHRMRLEAGGYKAARERELATAAEQAIDDVRSTGYPFRFPPMNSRERRSLHLLLSASGLRSESAGEGPWRSVVLHPSAEQKISAPDQGVADRERLERLRKSFSKRS